VARQNIDEKWKTDPRRTALAKRIGGRAADGMRVELNWLILDHKGAPVPAKEFEFIENGKDWIECGLAEVKSDGVHIAGADRYIEYFEKQKRNGKKPKQAKRSQTKPNKPSSSISSSSSSSDSLSNSSSGSKFVSVAPLATPAPANSNGLTRKIWESYSKAYSDRYKTAPVRNKTVNSQIKSIAARLGEEAPEVVGFYVSHSNAYYVKAAHPVGLCLKDAEGLRTQWATGRVVTHREAVHADNRAAVNSQLQRIREGSL
jgi:hypothetical protein